MKCSRVCLVGMFPPPPPLHGMSLINEYVKKRISASVIPLVIDSSPRNLDRSFMVRFGKIFRVIRCIFQLFSYLVAGRVGSVYLGLSGGKRQMALATCHPPHLREILCTSTRRLNRWTLLFPADL